MIRPLIAIALFFQVAAVLSQAQSTDNSTAALKPPAERSGASAAAGDSVDYCLGAGDTVEVTVIGVPGLEKREFALDGQGRISLPYVNQVDLLGLTAHQAEQKITALFGGSFLEDPQVTVSVKGYKSQFFYAIGAVKNPGTHQITRQVSLLDALNLAGGLDDKADTRIQLHRSASTGAGANGGGSVDLPPGARSVPGAPGSVEIDLSQLITRGDTASRIQVYSGDVITVPEKQETFYYVLGDVQKPGAFLMTGTDRITVSKAIAKAGGVLRTASGGKTLIIRQKPGSELPEQIKVDATAVLRGEVKDFDLLEDDVVLVPGSASKTLGKSLVGSIGGLLTSLLVIGIR